MGHKRIPGARYSPHGPNHWRPTHPFPILVYVNRNEPVVSASSVATLVAVTKEANLALDGQREARVTQFPFKVLCPRSRAIGDHIYRRGPRRSSHFSQRKKGR